MCDCRPEKMAIGRYVSSFAAFGLLALSALNITRAYEMKALTDPVIMGESPFWDDTTNTVIFVDIIGKKVLRYDPARPGELKSVQIPGAGRVSPAVPVAGSSSLLVGTGCSVVLADIDWGSAGQNATLKSVKVLATVDIDKPGNRFNDGKADYMGRLWIGTMDDSFTARRRRSSRASRSGRGSMYRFDLHSNNGVSFVETERVLEHMEIPNGLVWTTRKTNGWRTFYLADSGTSTIYSYDFLSLLGFVIRQQVVFDFTANNITGVPDGMTIDIDGNLWVACVHGSQVIKVNPRTGELLQVIPMPVKSVSAVEWGGANRDVLYVTTSRYKMTKEQLEAELDAGRMFAITGLGTRGHEGQPYRVRSRSSTMQPSLTLLISLLAVYYAFYIVRS